MNPFGTLTRPALVLLVLLSGSTAVRAQQTRAEILAALRAEKAEDIAAGRIHPEGSDKLERVVNYIEEGPFLGWFSEDFAGFHPQLGDLATGSGLALGLAYAYPFVHNDAFVHASASISTNVYRRFQVKATLPTFANISVGVRARHRNYPQMLYFGLGTDTAEDDRTSYRLVDTGLQVEARYRILSWLSAGVRVSGFGPDIGPGTIDDVPTTEEVFDERTAPGIEVQPNFLESQLFVEVDYRDVPNNARAGGFYSLSHANYDDLDFDRYNFRRLDAEATQLLPFFDKRRVLVLHGRMAHSYAGPGNAVPFYLMPYIGGDDTTRGYFEYRFHDRNLVVVNAEYRWEAFAGLDVALFFDAGKVANELGDIRLSDLKTSYGIGFRFTTRNRFVLRVDIGTGGGEGTRVFIKFNHAF